MKFRSVRTPKPFFHADPLGGKLPRGVFYTGTEMKSPRTISISRTIQIMVYDQPLKVGQTIKLKGYNGLYEVTYKNSSEIATPVPGGEVVVSRLYDVRKIAS
jgi:CxxC motif-containing protein